VVVHVWIELWNIFTCHFLICEQQPDCFFHFCEDSAVGLINGTWVFRTSNIFEMPSISDLEFFYWAMIGVTTDHLSQGLSVPKYRDVSILLSGSERIARPNDQQAYGVYC
jgi:hypothetical protein